MSTNSTHTVSGSRLAGFQRDRPSYSDGQSCSNVSSCFFGDSVEWALNIGGFSKDTNSRNSNELANVCL